METKSVKLNGKFGGKNGNFACFSCLCHPFHLLLKKDAQCQSFELNFIWGKMKTAARETAPQIILRNCSKEVVGEVNKILVKGEFSAIKH